MYILSYLYINITSQHLCGSQWPPKTHNSGISFVECVYTLLKCSPISDKKSYVHLQNCHERWPLLAFLSRPPVDYSKQPHDPRPCR